MVIVTHNSMWVNFLIIFDIRPILECTDEVLHTCGRAPPPVFARAGDHYSAKDSYGEALPHSLWRHFRRLFPASYSAFTVLLGA